MTCLTNSIRIVISNKRKSIYKDRLTGSSDCIYKLQLAKAFQNGSSIKFKIEP